MKISPINFGKRTIGPGSPVVIIAEIGINHEGDPDICMRLIKAAAQAGADAVKLQTIDANENYVPGTESHTLFSKAELSQDATAAAFNLARSLGMEAMTTCGDLRTLAWIEELAPSAHKISSGLITHLPLIRAAASTGRPLIMSTGMCGLDVIREAVENAKEAGASGICLLQCTSIYPAPLESLHLRAIATLGSTFSCPAGFSDHSVGHEAAALAVASGALVIEKHFSLDPSRLSFDHRLSLNPKEFSMLVGTVRRAEAMLGTANKDCTAEQVAAGHRYLRSIVARRDIRAGEPLTLENVGFMRTLPEYRGLSPAHWDKLSGHRLIRKIQRHEIIRAEDLAD